MTYKKEDGSPNYFAYLITALQAIILLGMTYVLQRIEANASTLNTVCVNQAVVMNQMAEIKGFVGNHDRNRDLFQQKTSKSHHINGCGRCKER